MRVSLAFLFLFLLSACDSREQSAPSTLRIGAVASLTGPAAEQGSSWLRGASLALKEARARGEAVELLVENDETNPSKAAIVFNRLAQVHKVQAVIGATWDFLGEPLYVLAEKYSIPIITPSNPVGVLSEAAKKNPFVYSNAVTLRAERDVLTRFINLRRISKVALVYSDIPWGNAHADLLKDMARELKLSIIADERFTLESYPTILKSIALRLKRSQPQLIFSTLDAAGLDNFLRELRQLDSSALVVNTQHLQSAFNLSGDKKRFENAYAVYPNIQKTTFDQRFQEEYGEEPSFLAAEGYDALNFLLAVFHKEGRLVRNLDFRFQGIAGEFHLPTRDGGVVKNEAGIYSLRGGLLVAEDI